MKMFQIAFFLILSGCGISDKQCAKDTDRSVALSTVSEVRKEAGYFELTATVEETKYGNGKADGYSHCSEEKLSVKDVTADRLPIDYVVCRRRLGQVKLEPGHAVSGESFEIPGSSDEELVFIASRVSTNPCMAQFHALDGTFAGDQDQDACYDALMSQLPRGRDPYAWP